MKKKKLLIIFILILALVFCTFAGIKITTNVQNKQMEKLNNKELFSYIVYDNQDEKNIKTLVTINSENGIEYIECPDGRKINGNSKSTITLDYMAEKNKDNEFKIKEIEKEIINFIEVNDLEKEKCLKIAKEVEDNVSLKTKLQDSLLILYKMNDYMELIFMIKSKLKKLKA